MKKNVVLDTNILVSAAISPNGNPAKSIEFLRNNEDIQVYYSREILAEYEEVLSRPQLNISAGTKTRIISSVISDATLIAPAASTIKLPDESDRIFYDAAKKSSAILVTGNGKHYPAEKFIMTPAQFVALFN